MRSFRHLITGTPTFNIQLIPFSCQMLLIMTPVYKQINKHRLSIEILCLLYISIQNGVISTKPLYWLYTLPYVIYIPRYIYIQLLYNCYKKTFICMGACADSKSRTLTCRPTDLIRCMHESECIGTTRHKRCVLISTITWCGSCWPILLKQFLPRSIVKLFA